MYDTVQSRGHIQGFLKILHGGQIKGENGGGYPDGVVTPEVFLKFFSLSKIYLSLGTVLLKVHKHEKVLNFFCPCSISDKMLILFFWFLPKFRCWNIFLLTEHTGNLFFVASYLIFSLVHFDPIRKVSWRWIPTFYSRKFHFNFDFFRPKWHSLRSLLFQGPKSLDFRALFI